MATLDDGDQWLCTGYGLKSWLRVGKEKKKLFITIRKEHQSAYRVHTKLHACIVCQRGRLFYGLLVSTHYSLCTSVFRPFSTVDTQDPTFAPQSIPATPRRP